ncbi:MAG TPA: NAD-dependent epimerase, partial [Burkholderiaceae bacterium]|nr:NAD-dependent epimerase [Burkholderiaceae bacterium]
MDDALRATIELMEAPTERIRERGSYNLSAMSFTPREIAEAIARRVPGFRMECAPDFRQAIAANWPRSIDDTAARRDWGWQARYGLEELVDEMLTQLAPRVRAAAEA